MHALYDIISTTTKRTAERLKRKDRVEIMRFAITNDAADKMVESGFVTLVRTDRGMTDDEILELAGFEKIETEYDDEPDYQFNGKKFWYEELRVTEIDSLIGDTYSDPEGDWEIIGVKVKEDDSDVWYELLNITEDDPNKGDESEAPIDEVVYFMTHTQW